MRRARPTKTGVWTLRQLAEQVKHVLAPRYAAAAWEREVPSETTIRYYTTLGVVDPPAEKRGRVVYYTERHLWQIIATKHLQASGLLLDEIRERLIGLTTDQIEFLAIMDSLAGSGAFPMAAAQLGQESFARAT